VDVGVGWGMSCNAVKRAEYWYSKRRMDKGTHG
jgi:hypothetical protein